MKNASLLPLFPTPVAVFEVEEDLQELQKLKEDFEFVPTNSRGSHNAEMTERLDVLEDFPESKSVLMKYFRVYVGEMLKYRSVNFEITTSWGTRMGENSFSQLHDHKNSVYSGVFYLDDGEDQGCLEFDAGSLFPQGLMIGDPDETDLINARVFGLRPKKNMLVFFPSYLMHRVNTHESSTPRHSIAFNLFPVGRFGSVDSSISISLVK